MRSLTASLETPADAIAVFSERDGGIIRSCGAIHQHISSRAQLTQCGVGGASDFLVPLRRIDRARRIECNGCKALLSRMSDLRRRDRRDRTRDAGNAFDRPGAKR